jgi:glycosyltransferase involved in cell wall biosynthesis
MEFLFIDSPAMIDWQLAGQINQQTDLCIALSDLRGGLDITVGDSLDRIEIIHCGVKYYPLDACDELLLASPSWTFLRPNPNISSTSWLASFHCILIRKGVLGKLNIDTGYKCGHFIAADLTLQVLKNGGRVWYEPQLTASYDGKVAKVPEADLKRLLLRFYGKGAFLLAFPLSIGHVLSRRSPRRLPQPSGKFDQTVSQKRLEIGEYTAIIPTINRYAYLKKAIYSLLNNRRPPAEIIIVDQTPPNLRIHGYYDEFHPNTVKVFFLERAGQSTARNAAIMKATREWILFFDDDSEAWEDMIDEHIWLLEHSEADVSTGVSLAPWKDRSYIPSVINYYHLSTVLDTGNCMTRKDTVEAVGMLDPAFDKGSGADDNLGKRLYLAGKRIIFNPKAIRTHYKAPMGGLREHGAWWKNKGTFFGPFPLPTESYDFLSFYPKRSYLRLCVYRLIRSFRRSNLPMNLVNTVFFPIKVYVSYRRAMRLVNLKGNLE